MAQILPVDSAAVIRQAFAQHLPLEALYECPCVWCGTNVFIVGWLFDGLTLTDTDPENGIGGICCLSCAAGEGLIQLGR